MDLKAFRWRIDGSETEREANRCDRAAMTPGWTSGRHLIPSICKSPLSSWLFCTRVAHLQVEVKTKRRLEMLERSAVFNSVWNCTRFGHSTHTHANAAACSMKHGRVTFLWLMCREELQPFCSTLCFYFLGAAEDLKKSVFCDVTKGTDMLADAFPQNSADFSFCPYLIMCTVQKLAGC